MTLIQLPGEILAMIGREAIPETFESLMLSCKAVHAAISPLLLEYNMIRHFKHFSYRKQIPSRKGWSIRTPCQLIYEVALQPKIAQVIEFADLRRDMFDDEDQSDLWNGMDPTASEEVRTAIEQVVGGSSVVQELKRHSGEEFDWPSAILKLGDPNESSRDSSSAWATAFILTLLPNVRTLAIGQSFLESQDQDDSSFISTVAKLFEIMANDRNRSGSSAVSLGQLSELVPSWGSSYDTRLPLHAYQWLFSLPSMEVCSLYSCVCLEDGYTGIPWIGRVQLFPRIKELNLFDSVLGADEVYEVTSRMPHLETLSVEFGTKWHGCGSMDLEFDRFITELGRAAGAQLRSLSLRLESEMPDWETSIKSLHCLSRLEELEIEGALLFDGSGDDPSLVKALPPSLQRLRVYLDKKFDRTGALHDLFNDFAAQYSSLLPDLQVVEVVVPKKEVRQRWHQVLKDLESKVPILQALTHPGFDMQTIAEPYPDWFELDHD